jgi:CelD/BcsL family acetyltransferase involved in cellulose biosynthesis
MSLLREATVEQSAAKVGIFAPQGAGKTTTALLIALGLSKTYHNNAPIAFMDTENGSDYVVPIAQSEGVKLMNFKSRAFKDMRTGLREAEDGGCCAYIVDSYTHPWKELVDTFKAKSRRKKLEFHHMDELKSLWQAWTDQMLRLGPRRG